MALGLGFNKARILNSAEKYVLQGKLPAAIAEYQKILKKDPKDLMALNTVGDLYVRAGKTEEAIKCFYDLAEKSIEAGFVPRAIAVYKRITKIEQDSLPALKRLGELYSMQGLMRDARTHYLQAVEIHMRRREPEAAREVFEKILMLDMDNPRLQRRMAELYAETRKRDEAIATYLTAAGRFLELKDPAEAASTLESLANLDPENAEAQVLHARVRLEQGESGKAIETLQTLASKDGGKVVFESLFEAYVDQGDWEHAEETARQLFEKHDEFSGLEAVAEEQIKKGKFHFALQIFQGAAEKLKSQRAFPVLIQGLKKVLKSEAANIPALELLWGAYRSSGEIGEGREIAEQLATAYVAAEQLPEARDVYRELVALEPDVPEHQRLLKQVEARMGEDGRQEREISADPSPLVAMEAAAAPDEESTRLRTLPPREQELIKNCLTESELYVNYKQFSRAIATLEKGVQEFPGEASLHEHLMPLYEQTQRYGDAARCAQALAEIYVTLGDGERAARYGELLTSYQEKARASSSGAVVETPFDTENLEPAAPDQDAMVAAEPQVREVDLSMEWATLSDSAAPEAAASSAESIVEEIEFYLQAGLLEEAGTAIRKLSDAATEHPSLQGFQERLAAQQEPSLKQAPATSPIEEAAAGSEAVAAVDTEVAPSETPTTAEPDAISAADLMEPATKTSPPEQAGPAPEAAPAPGTAEPDWVLEDVVQQKTPVPSGFELSLEDPSGQEPAAAAAAQDLHGSATAEPATQGQDAGGGAPSAQAAGAGFLEDVFAEFKENVGEAPAGGAEEDLETHYNMGVAFKEMALYDEAIGEFQKVHQLAESAKDYSHVVQCCSLLATCFLEKGMPQLAAQWYQTAINAPGVDAESSLALWYELGSAQELAGERQAALKSFMEVYARNIDYRNVAERIQELKQNP